MTTKRSIYANIKRWAAVIAVSLVAIPSPVLTAAEAIGKAETERMVSTLQGAAVRIEVFVQQDGDTQPQGALGMERCPNCGRVHDNNLAQMLEQERPCEITGYLVGPDRVACSDPQMNPRFIKSIIVHWRDLSSPATIHCYAQKYPAILLTLQKPLGAALNFAATGEPAWIGYASRKAGSWSVGMAPFPGEIVFPEKGEAYRPAAVNGVIFSRDGQQLGMALGPRLMVSETWRGSPGQWPQWSGAQVSENLDSLRKACLTGLPHVRLSFRSPRKSASETERISYGDSDETGNASTERDVLGVVMTPNRVLVPVSLKPQITARLKRIQIISPDGHAIEAQFEASLKEFGAMIVKTEKPLEGGLMLNAKQDLRELHLEALLRGDIVMRGENRSAHFHIGRISDLVVGPRGRLYPTLLESMDEHAFLLTWDRQLLAMPMTMRGQISGANEGYSYGNRDATLTPIRYLHDAMTQLPQSADPANVPVSEAEENRLAWMGVELQGLTRELARANKVADQTEDGKKGGMVTYVHPDSPAGKAGVQAGWILLRLKVEKQSKPIEVEFRDDYRRMQNFPWEQLDQVPQQYFERLPAPWPSVENSLTRVLSELGFGRRYTAEFFAEGKLERRDFEVAPGPAHFESAARHKSERLGLTVREMTYEVRRYLQRKADEPGVVVSKLEEGGKATVAGIKPYELITHINDQPLNTIADFEKLSAQEGELRLSIKRMAKGRIVRIN